MLQTKERLFNTKNHLLSIAYEENHEKNNFCPDKE